MGMDRKLFEKKPSQLIEVIKAILFALFKLVMLIIIAGSIGVAVGFVSFWWKNTKFVDKLTYKWALEEQYNTGRFHERMCAILLKDRKEPLNLTQKDFCDRHNNYKDHPERLGG